MKYLLASGREIDINQKDKHGKTALGWIRESGNMKIVKLIESFERNQNETRFQLRIQLGFAGKSLFFFAFK